MAYIQSAYFGDETSQRNITDVIKDKITGGKIDVLANSSLLPMFEIGKQVTLTKEDEKDITDNAIQLCGNANDTQCIESRKQDLQRQRLEEKERKQNSSANVVKGRRLTVKVVDQSGRTRTLVVPDGQYFRLDGVQGKPDGPIELPDGDQTWKYVASLIGIVVYYFIQTYGAAGAYRTLNGYSTFRGFSFQLRDYTVNPILLVMMFFAFTIPFMGYIFMYLTPLILGEPNLM